MKLSEAKNLSAGAKVQWKVDKDTYCTGTFIRMMEVTRFPNMTFNDLMSGRFDLSKGKKELQCYVEYKDDDGRVHRDAIRPRRLTLVR